MALIFFVYEGISSKLCLWAPLSTMMNTGKLIFEVSPSFSIYVFVVYGGCDDFKIIINNCIQPPLARVTHRPVIIIVDKT